MIGNSDPGFGEVLVSNMFTCGAAGEGMTFAGYNYTVWLSAIRIMELTGFGPSHRLKTHNASLPPPTHSKPALPVAPTSWRNTLSLSILLLWWVERYSEQCDRHKNAGLMTAVRLVQGRSESSCISYLKTCLAIQEGQAGHSHLWLLPIWMSGSVNHEKKKKESAPGQITFRPSSRITDIKY